MTWYRASLTRREILRQCLGSLAIFSSFRVLVGAEAVAQQRETEHRRPTPPNEIGPFYKKNAPQTAMLRSPGDPGMPLMVRGQVFNTRGEALPNAVIEVWQADHLGQYDLDGYRYRAQLPLDPAGAYQFDSVIPGHHPDRVCQRIHYLVLAPGYKPLITQLYFATDPVFEGDPDHNFGRDPLLHNSRELVRPVVLAGDPHDMQALVHFDLVLELL
jgi:protocatechuate 3,4-dioxygenase beta subunit